MPAPKTTPPRGRNREAGCVRCCQRRWLPEGGVEANFRGGRFGRRYPGTVKILAWNLNHRAARRRIPAWVYGAIAAESPDVVILTEYVEGEDHAHFVGELAALGLVHADKTKRQGRQNELLVLARQPLKPGGIGVPAIHPSVPSNFLHVRLVQCGIDVIGFRMPAFAGKELPRKRETWEWLIGELASLDHRTVVVGDFNTQQGDASVLCGDCLERVAALGWTVAIPSDGFSWKSPGRGSGRKLDFALVSPGLRVESVSYSWAFTGLATEAAELRTGLPDHAMLLLHVEAIPDSVATATGSRVAQPARSTPPPGGC